MSVTNSPTLTRSRSRWDQVWLPRKNPPFCQARKMLSNSGLSCSCPPLAKPYTPGTAWPRRISIICSTIAARVMRGGSAPVVGRSSMVTANSVCAVATPGNRPRRAASNQVRSARRRPRRRDGSIELEGIFVAPPEAFRLIVLPQETIPDGQDLDLRPHETAEGILRGAHDGLSAHVEARVHEDGAAGARLEGREQRVELWIGLPVHGLQARGVVHVRHRGDVRSRYVQLVDAEERLLVQAHAPTSVLRHLGDHEHVRAVVGELEPLSDVFSQHCRREGTEGLAILHAEVEALLHGRRTRIGEDGPAAERPRPELHAALEPSDGLFLYEGIDDRRH